MSVAKEIKPAPRNYRRWYVISYDVPDDKRRTKIMKILAGYGQRIQYSVFECELRPADVDKLKARLKAAADAKQDDVRMYMLCENCLQKVEMLGRAVRHQRVDFLLIE